MSDTSSTYHLDRCQRCLHWIATARPLVDGVCGLCRETDQQQHAETQQQRELDTRTRFEIEWFSTWDADERAAYADRLVRHGRG